MLQLHENDHGDTGKHFHAIATIFFFFEICFYVHRPLEQLCSIKTYLSRRVTCLASRVMCSVVTDLRLMKLIFGYSEDVTLKKYFTSSLNENSCKQPLRSVYSKSHVQIRIIR